MGKIVGEPIGYVDAGRRKAAAQKRLPDRKARLRKEVGMVFRINRAPEFAGVGDQRGEFGGGTS